MTLQSTLLYVLFLGIVTALVRPVGAYLARVFDGEPTPGDRLFRPVENGLFRLMRVDPADGMTWRGYATAFTLFSAVGTLALFALLMLQSHLPGGPSPATLSTPMTASLASNTAVSFATTTTWQAYAGESTMKDWTQLVGLASQNFLAGAAGLAVGVAFIRGFARSRSPTIGNFWADCVRAVTRVLLPISVVGALALVWQGVPMTFGSSVAVTTLEGHAQTIARGPAAALEIIKNLGTNGGGFFNANGAHPYEGPTALANFLGMLAIAVLPAALTHTFGLMTDRPGAGWLIYGAMVAIFAAGLIAADAAERVATPALAQPGVAAGINMEGKEARFGLGQSVLTIVATSNGATGSNAGMNDSLSPLGVAVPLCNLMLGEIAFGGLGTGLYSMLIVALVGVFLAGLMTGRTPEYVGKKLGVAEMKLVAIFSLATPLAILIPTAVAVATDAGRAGLTTNGGARGFVEVLFAYASCCANNGQAMAGLSANSTFYNLTTIGPMLVGRFGLAIAALALAGRLAAQQRRHEHAGTLPSHSLTLGLVILASAALIVLLNFLPALALGPVAEHLMLHP